MSTPPPIKRTLLVQGATSIDVTLMSPVQRSLGTAGDPVVLRIPAGSWPEGEDGFDDRGDFWLCLDADGPNPLTLKTYRLRSRQNAEIGIPLGGGSPTAATQYVTLDTSIRWWRESRGGMISRGVINEVTEDGLVDTDSSTYRTNEDLVNAALADLGVDHEACPSSINTSPDGAAIDAPGPLDWGNAEALPELEALTMRVGYALAFGIDGVLRVVRLARAGTSLSLSGPIAAIAEPYTPDIGPGIRGSKILVTSGATRTTAIQRRAISELEWVAFDERTNTWLNQADFDILYPGEIGPEDLAHFRAGLTGDEIDPVTAKQFAQIYTALALKSGPGGVGGDRAKCSMFVNIPGKLDPDASAALAKFAGTPGVVEARVAIDMGREQFRNAPISSDSPLLRLEGLKAIPREGVFVLPSDAIYARVGSGVTGRRGDLVPLSDGDLHILFAHESNTGQETLDFGIWGFELSADSPATMSEMDAAEVLAAYTDPDIIKVHAPYLQQIVYRETDGDFTFDTRLNGLVRLASLIAWARIANDRLSSAVVALRGLVAINPGDEGGKISRVIWDQDNLRTYLMINQHERPGSEEEMRQRAAGDSVSAGISRVRLARSQASLSDARASATADRGVGFVGAGSPAANAVQRGQQRAIAGVMASRSEGPQPGEGLARLRERTTIYARLNPAEMPPTEISANRWEYDWEEVRLCGRDPDSDGALRTSTTHGKAINLAEVFNAGTGILGNGIEIENIPAGFALVPIGPRVVSMEGPHWDETDEVWVWYFQAANVLDGACVVPLPPPEEEE